MASLEVLLGVAAAVVLLGVLAVRVSVRLGLPSLLLYLGIGILLGESVLGIRFSDAGLTEALGLGALVLILAEGGLTTRWATVRPALGVGIALSTVAVVVSIAVVGTALHVAARPGLAHGVPLGRGAVVDRRRGGVQRAARGGREQAAARRPGAGVGNQRRAGGARRRPARLGRPDHLARPRCWWSYELVAGAVVGYVLGRGGRLGAAPRRAAGDGPVPAGRASPSACSPTRRAARARLRAARDLRRRAGPRQLQPAAPRRRAVVRRGHGLAGPDRAVRAARALRLARPAARRRRPRADRRGRAAGGRAAAVGRSRRRRRSGCRGASRHSCRGRGCAVRCRSCWRSSRCRRVRRTRSGCVDAVFVLVVVLTLLQGTTLPFVARRLGVVAGEPREIEVDAAPLDELGADLLQVRVPAGSRLRGVYLRELRLPRGATVSLVVRDEAAFTPRSTPGCAWATSCSSSPPPRPATPPSGGSGRSTGPGGWPAGTGSPAALTRGGA